MTTPGIYLGDSEADRPSLEVAGVEHDSLAGRNPECRHQDGQDTDSSSRLEDLPAELRCHLLISMPDLPTLRSLVRASPVLHAQYLHNRMTILRTCLGRELHGFVVDAVATLMSRVRILGSPRTDEKITDFLATYRGWLAGSTPHPDVHSLEPGCVRWMAAYHLSIALPLARQYSQWALENLSKGVLSAAAQDEAGENRKAHGCHDDRLSRSEETRVFQALYRFATYQHLFGRNDGRRHGGFQDFQINEHFFCLFHPWEAEAVGCIEWFIRQKYEELFDKVTSDLHETNPRFMQPNGVINPSDSFDLIMERDDYLDGTMSRGLKTIVRLLAIDDHGKLVTEMERRLTHFENLDATMRDALRSVAQCYRRDELISGTRANARDEAEQRRDPMDFTGDAVPPGEGPPLAWVLLWGGKYANIYGGYVPKPLQQWGYVMWDEWRWTAMGAKGLVARQWEMVPELVEEIEIDYDWSPID